MPRAVPTDGSAKKAKPGQAGWGYTACLLDGTPAEVLDAAASTTSASPPLYEESGRVVTNEKAPEFLGASKGTNNTGELSAVHHALTRANAVLPHGTQTTVLVLADSMLAICTTTGAWAARSNRTLVNKNKRALARLRGKGIDVRFRHIRAHEGHRMNERADALAKQGGQGLRQRESTPIKCEHVSSSSAVSDVRKSVQITSHTCPRPHTPIAETTLNVHTLSLGSLS